CFRNSINSRSIPGLTGLSVSAATPGKKASEHFAFNSASSRLIPSSIRALINASRVVIFVLLYDFVITEHQRPFKQHLAFHPPLSGKDAFHRVPIGPVVS